MTANFTYAASEKTSMKTNSPKKIENGLKRLLVFAGIVFAMELIWLFGVSPFIPFSVVEVQDFKDLGRAEILKMSGIGETSSFMSTNVKEVQERLSACVLVESARVIKRFPDKLSIFLVPRQAAAAALTAVGSKQKMLYVDRYGVFFKTGEAGEEAGSLPILSGLENPQLNMRLPAGLKPLVESISVIASSSPELLAAISEIRIEQKAFDGYDLVLYPVHSPIKVRIENNLTEEVLKFTLLMLNVFESGSQKPEEIDFRSGMGTYKIKEQSLW